MTPGVSPGVICTLVGDFLHSLRSRFRLCFSHFVTAHGTSTVTFQPRNNTVLVIAVTTRQFAHSFVNVITVLTDSTACVFEALLVFFCQRVGWQFVDRRFRSRRFPPM